MERLYKCLLIMGLLSVSLSASVFMVIEAGKFFQTLYPAGDSMPYMGYWGAALAEIFMAVMAGTRLPNIKRNNKEKTHPGNFVFKVLLVLLFTATAGGAALNLLFPVMDKIKAQKNNTQIISLLKSQVKDHEKSLDIFTKSKRRVNSTLFTIRNQLKTKDELKKSFKNQELAIRLWIEAAFVIFIRCVLQLANLSCVWLAGWLYRKPLNKPAANLPKISSSPEDLKPEENHFDAKDKRPEKTLIPGKNKTQNVIKLNQGSELRPKPSIKNNLCPGEFKIISKIFSKKQEATPPKKDERGEEILNFRKKISNLLRARNHNVPLAEICELIGERESEIKNILNFKIRLEAERLPKLKNIIKKLEALRSDEPLESFGY